MRDDFDTNNGEHTSSELYPFDDGRCDCCRNERFENGDCICLIYHKRCAVIHGCTCFVRDYPISGVTLGKEA